ncbi:MAG: protein kinase [gamma proteobacterium symbiont of Taylorina sp.]|nr:protein kinase [gamma proteobacterium symbiont of Taylorina sp.]
MGTMAYMSPEQRRSATEVTFKSDLYSLGILMYKLFTHRDPIGRFKAPDELEQEIPHNLSQIILQCLETEAEDRPASANEIKDTLLLILRGAHLQTEQRERVQKDFKQFDLLDVISENKYSSVMLFQNRTSKKLIIIKKRTIGDAGFEEAKLLTSLKHPNILNILGTSNNQRYYIIVMEYLKGGNLQERLVQTIQWRNFIPMAKEIATGLAFAHKNRIVHGNLRPVNILFNETEQIKLTDFNLEEHYIKSTPKNNWYRLKNEQSSVRQDIFSIGVIYYQMLVGSIPVLSDQTFLLNKTFKQLPLKLQQLIASMLKIIPQERIDNFSLVLSQLDDIMTEANMTLISPKKMTKTKKRYKISPLLYSIITLILLLFLFYYFVDLQEIQYIIEDIFFPQETQEAPVNFIELQ